MRVWSLVLAGLLLPGVAGANDSVAVIAAGGLEFTKTDAVAMEREDLFLSPREVRVRYKMRNLNGAPVTLRVAFPMPALPVDDNPWPRRMPGPAPNLLNFHVRVNGKHVDTAVEVKSLTADGRDVTEDLRRIGGWSLVLRPHMLTDDAKQFDFPELDVGPTVLGSLRAAGLVKSEDGAAWPLWRTHVTYHWMQVFPPGVTLVEHRYWPASGSFLFSLHDGAWKGGAVGDDDDVGRAYCLDDAARRRLGEVAGRLKPGENGYLRAASLAYVLTTGANWAGPIGTFHVVVEGGKDAALVALCSEVPLRATAPARLEGTATGFVPKRDLRVLVVEEPGK